MVRKKINAAILMAALTVSMLTGCGSQKDKQDNNNGKCTDRSDHGRSYTDTGRK